MSASRDAKGIDICVCTYRRPQLLDCLRSLNNLAQPNHFKIQIIVADNDITPSAKAIVDEVSAELKYPVRYVHCPAQNISLARNACLDASKAAFLAFIDDDEVATEQWINHLLHTIEVTNADVALGPVDAEYMSDAPKWMSQGDFHSTFPVFVDGVIRTGYTCNVLMRMSSVHISDQRFNLQLGRTGGEDTEFFSDVFAHGGRICYSSQAWVREDVPTSRASIAWLAKRRFRMGQTHGRLLARQTRWTGLLTQASIALAKTSYCLGVATLSIVSNEARNRALLRGVLHSGSLFGMLGVREIQPYGTHNSAIT